MGTIEGNIGRHPKNRLQNTVHVGDDKFKGKHAITHYQVIERFGYLTLVNCTLETGRTHQIRVHLSHKNLPIIGDRLYNPRKHIAKNTSESLTTTIQNFSRQALHASKLKFPSIQGEKLFEFQSALPEDMQSLINIMK